MIENSMQENIRVTGVKNKAEIEKLAERAKHGEREALVSLCKKIAKDVLFRVSWKFQNHMDAEDVTQEVLIRVCDNIHNLRDPKAFGAWLNKIITNETNRYASNSLTRNAVININEFFEDYLDTAVEESKDCIPHDFMIREDDRRMVTELLKKLPERQLEAILLHYYEDMSLNETAEAMEVSRPCVSRYLILAQNKIKEEIQKQSEKLGMTSRLALLPIGPLLTQVLHQEASLASTLSEMKIEQTVNNNANNLVRQAGNTVAAKAATGPLISIAIVLGLTLAVSLALLINNFTAGTQDLVTEQSTAYDVYGKVLFTGGDARYEHLNPKHAAAQTGSEYGELTIYGWRIETMDGAVLYSGEGEGGDEALAFMYESGKDGEYKFIFQAKDEAGNAYILHRSFLIDTGTIGSAESG